jgi:acyl-lipid omega-6 desaturase (Delta-12 desaturase)
MSAPVAAVHGAGGRGGARGLLSGAHQRRDARALAAFACDGALYAGCVAAAVLARPPGLKLLCSVLCALFITRLFIIAHDACHGSLLSRHVLNETVGRLGFLPSLTPFNLWQFGHNTLHHGYTNLKGRDYVWTPLSKAEYDALPPLRRFGERIYRGTFGQGLYYLVEIWWMKMMRPARRAAAGRRRFDTRDRRLVAAYAAALCLGAAAAARATGQSAALVLFAAVLLPFALWNAAMGFLIYLHHTHPRVAWFDTRREWSLRAAQLRQAIHVAFPSSVDALLHHIMDHTAHHVDTLVPLQQLPRAQALLEGAYPEEVPVQPFSWSYFRRCVATCKLYDYQRHRWLDFNGHVTAEVPLRAPVEAAAAAEEER